MLSTFMSFFIVLTQCTLKVCTLIVQGHNLMNTEYSSNTTASWLVFYKLICVHILSLVTSSPYLIKMKSSRQLLPHIKQQTTSRKAAVIMLLNTISLPLSAPHSTRCWRSYNNMVMMLLNTWLVKYLLKLHHLKWRHQMVRILQLNVWRSLHILSHIQRLSHVLFYRLLQLLSILE